MQYAWLEKLVKEGAVREDVKDIIYNDCAELLEKTSSEAQTFWAQRAPQLVDQIGTGIMLAGVWAGFNKIKGNIADNRQMSRLIDTKIHILKDQDFEQHKQKAEARFDELAKMFPHVAEQKELAKRLVKARLHTGFTPEDLSHLAASQKEAPSAGMQSRLKDSLSKKAEVRPEVMVDILADTLTMVKEAAGLNVLETNKNVLSTLAAIVGANLLVGLGSGGINVAKKAIENHQLKKKLNDSYEKAMRMSNPHEEPLLANKDKAWTAFETLAQFSPSTATNPSAARAFMNRMVSNPDIAASLSAVKELSEIERNLRSTSGSGPFLEGFRAGTEATNLGGVFQKGVTESAFPPKARDDSGLAGGRTRPYNNAGRAPSDPYHHLD